MQLDGGVRGIRVKNRTAPTKLELRLRFVFPFKSQCRITRNFQIYLSAESVWEETVSISSLHRVHECFLG